MIKQFKLKKDLYLIQQEVETQLENETKSPESEPTHFIFICDCSGSMYYELPLLREQVKEKARCLKIGDTLTIARFSGEGCYDYFIKGFKITTSSDFEKLDVLVDKYIQTMGLTCFSEVLSGAKNVIEDLKIFGDRFALFFLTDGYPVVSNYSKELKNIFSAIEEIEGSITSSALVGYSDYYNRELMSSMAEKMGSSLIHSNDMSSFSLILDNFIKNQNCISNKINVEIQSRSDVDIIFSLNGNSINLYSISSENSIKYTPVKGEKNFIYYFIKTPIASDDDLPSNDERLIQALYAAAIVFSQRAKTDLSLEMLGSVGDINFIDKLNNAFTNKEYGEAENLILEAIEDSSKRFIKGKDTNYLPKEDAFCLIDLVDLLSEDDESFWYPRHEKFNYKRRTQASKAIDGTPKFIYNENEKVSFKDLVWNDKRPNLSVRAKLKGFVEFNDNQHEKYGIANKFPSFVWRNYSIVSDGVLNIKEIPASLSNETFNKLKELGVINSNEEWEKDKIFILKLDAIPIMNRSIAKNKNSAEELFINYMKQLKFQAYQKVYNYFMEKENPREERIDEEFEVVFGKEGAEYLKENFITKNGFNPKSESIPATDHYIAKEFTIKCAGFSSLPKVEDVIEKINKGGKLNKPSQLMKEALEYMENCNYEDMTKEERISFLKESLSSIKSNLKTIRREIQEAKFSILLGKQWFKEFNSREENSLEIDENKFIVEITDKKVDY